MHIDWSSTELSNHQRLALREIMGAMPIHSSFDYVLPVDAGRRIIRISQHNAMPGFDAVALSDDQGCRAIDYDDEQSFGLDYHYRNARADSVSGFARFAGRIDHIAHASLLTAISGAEMGCFIPSQVGLKDLHAKAGWEINLEDYDHVWHRFERFAARPGSGGEPIESLVDACRQRLSTGYDDDLAMQQIYDMI